MLFKCYGQSEERSDIWKWFRKIEVEGKKKAKCMVCFKALAYHGSTTNLHDHLEGLHPLHYKKMPSKEQGTVGGTICLDTVPQCSDARVKEITNKIAEVIALDLRPVHMVEGKGFCNLIHFFEPGYTITSSKHFTAMLSPQHTLGKEKLKES